MKLISSSRAHRIRIRRMVQNHARFYLDDMIYIDMGGWASKDNVSLGHVKNLAPTIWAE